MKLSIIMFKANYVQKPYATLFALVDFFDLDKLFMKFSNIIFIANTVAKPYATLFALVNFFQRIKTFFEKSLQVQKSVA